MSYILDALKKAEAERELSQVPGLVSAQGNNSIYITRQGSTWAWWIAGLLALVLLAIVGTWAWHVPANSIPVEATAPAIAAPAAAPVQPTYSPAPPSPAPVGAATVRPAPVPVPVPVPVPAAAKPVVAKDSARAATAPAATPANAASAPVAAATGRPATTSVPLLSDLPEALRRQIPAMHISGAVYSDTPPEWTLIINDHVLSRGSQVSPDLLLEEVTGSSAVFSFKGQRFRMDR